MQHVRGILRGEKVQRDYIKPLIQFSSKRSAMKHSDTYYMLSFTIPMGQKEAVLGICYSYAVLGCEEEDRDLSAFLRFYCTSEESALSAKAEIARQFPSTEPVISSIPDQDWNAEWIKSIKPVYITENCVVSPAWLKPVLKHNDYWIKIEPKMSFGTGHHETTRLAAQGLLSLEIFQKAGTRLLDIGTGSGILCFAAEHAGYSLCIGIDNDPVCAENCAENKAVNSSKGAISFLVATLDAFRDEPEFDVIVMNMIQTQSQPLLPKCKKLLLSGGRLIWSGILWEDRNSAIEHALNTGWSVESQLGENEWWCGILYCQ